MNVLEHFKDQPVHQQDGKDHWLVMTNKSGPLEVHHVPVSEIEKFLEGLEFDHIVGLIPRFNKPNKKPKADVNT